MCYYNIQRKTNRPLTIRSGRCVLLLTDEKQMVWKFNFAVKSIWKERWRFGQIRGKRNSSDKKEEIQLEMEKF